MAKTPMKRECRELLSKASGLDISEEDSAEILEVLKEAGRMLRENDPDGWAKLSDWARGEMIANEAKKDLSRRAQAIRRRASLTIDAQARNDAALKEIFASGKRGLRASQELIERAYRKVLATQNEYATRFLKIIDGKLPRKHLFFEDPEFSRNLIREIYGVTTDSDLAYETAKTFTQVSEELRQRFNSLGGEMGKLDHWFPQTHNVQRMRHAAEILRGEGSLKQFANTVRNTVTGAGNQRERNREAWIYFVWDRLDTDRYKEVIDEGGMPAMHDLLGRMYDTIITDGDVSFDTSTVAGKSAANRGSRINRGELHRQIHFRDADAFYDYLEKFGNGDTVSVALNSIKRMAKDVALLESFGPNPNFMVEGIKRVGEADVRQDSLTQGIFTRPIGPQNFDAMWSTLNGDSSSILPGREVFANAMQGWRNAEVFGKLQSTFINSFSDAATYVSEAMVFRTPAYKAFTNLMTSLFNSGEHRDLLIRAGVMADTMSQALLRWGENNMGTGWSSMLANGVMKASLLDWWTRGVRQAQMINMMGAMSEMTKHSWKDVDPFVKKQLERAGVTETSWLLWGKAGRTNIRGADFLDTQNIRELQEMRQGLSFAELRSLGEDLGIKDFDRMTNRDFDNAASSYIAFLTNESYFASLQPDLFTRAATNMGFQKGTIPGELARSFMLFKGFPVGFLHRHIERMCDLNQTRGKWSAVGYASTVFGLSTFLGGLSVEVAELLAGRDPQDPLSADFALQAIARGGGAGFLGDLIVSGLDGQNAYGGQNWLRLMGPVFGTAFDSADAVKAWINEGLYDRDSSASKKTLSLIRGHMPFVNLWYAKGIIDRAVYNDLMEMASPGYLDRVWRFQQKYKGSGYWWPQDSLSPERTPRMAEHPDN